jgi:hypothetical protein
MAICAFFASSGPTNLFLPNTTRTDDTLIMSARANHASIDVRDVWPRMICSIILFFNLFYFMPSTGAMKCFKNQLFRAIL